MDQSRPLFVYFRSFLVTISTQIEKSIDGMLGIRTRGRRMEGADESTELWRPPLVVVFHARKIFNIMKRASILSKTHISHTQARQRSPKRDQKIRPLTCNIFSVKLNN